MNVRNNSRATKDNHEISQHHQFAGQRGAHAPTDRQRTGRHAPGATERGALAWRHNRQQYRPGKRAAHGNQPMRMACRRTMPLSVLAGGRRFCATLRGSRRRRAGSACQRIRRHAALAGRGGQAGPATRSVPQLYGLTGHAALPSWPTASCESSAQKETAALRRRSQVPSGL